MILKVKRLILPNGIPYNGPLPSAATEGSAAFDIYAAHRIFLREMAGGLCEIPHTNVRTGDLVKYFTGLAFEITPGFVGLACARSSVVKYPLSLANGIGIIDSDYRGELSYIYRILNSTDIATKAYEVGERCGQLMITSFQLPSVVDVGSEELSQTNRGSGGYGSTGK